MKSQGGFGSARCGQTDSRPSANQTAHPDCQLVCLPQGLYLGAMDLIDLLAPRERLSFYDSQSMPLPFGLKAYDAWCRVMARPLPFLPTAFAIRDAISARFGVKRIGGFKSPPATVPPPGDHLDFFLVERSEPNILTLTAHDRHLDVMTCITTHHQRLTVTSSVITHNAFGRAYMLPVAPGHRLIVWLMLRRLTKDLAANDRHPTD